MIDKMITALIIINTFKVDCSVVPLLPKKTKTEDRKLTQRSISGRIFGRGTINTADYQLSMDLLATYPAGYNVLPVANPHDVVNVTFQMALYSIVDMNELDQSLTTNCEIITKWHDAFLTWDPLHYDNITDTRLPWDKVWTPDIVLYNSAGDGEQGSREMKTLIQVTYEGYVTLLTQSIYMSKCITDVTYYPFDAQACSLKFASWTTEVDRINMTYAKVSTSQLLRSYQPSGVFELKRIYAERHEAPDPCCDEDVRFADVTYYLVIWRRPKFFLFNYIQPAVLINILALFVFVIPAESGEKITLGISTMLNMTVFLLDTGLPATDQIPIISIYYAFTMILSAAATVMGVIVLRLHHQGTKGDPVPPGLIKLAKYLAVLSFSTYRYGPRGDSEKSQDLGMFHPLDSVNSSISPSGQSTPKETWRRVAGDVGKAAVRKKREMRDNWHKISSSLTEERRAENRWQMEERKEMINEEWKKVSRVVDRFLLILFSMLSLINTSWFLLTSFAIAPHFLDGQSEVEEEELIKGIRD